MTSNTIYLEVSKETGAILSYFLEEPATLSSKVDYVPATQDELKYLNALTDSIFAPGTVATLSDLKAHRGRVEAAKQACMSAHWAPQEPPKNINLAISTTASNNTDVAKASLIAAIKQHKPNKRKRK